MTSKPDSDAQSIGPAGAGAHSEPPSAEHYEFHDMPLTQVMKKWMDSEGWDDEIELDESHTRSRVVTSFGVEGQSYRTFLEVSEKDETFFVYMYSPFSCPPARMGDMARILNRINMRLRLGRLGCHDDDDANPVQFKACVDVEGGTLAGGQIDTLLGSASASFRQYGQLIASVALTKFPEGDLWKSFLEDEAKQEADDEGSGPSEL